MKCLSLLDANMLSGVAEGDNWEKWWRLKTRNVVCRITGLTGTKLSKRLGGPAFRCICRPANRHQHGPLYLLTVPRWKLLI